MKFITGMLTLVLALAISAVAAYFSVVGLAALFAATARAVIIMGCTLEAGKLASAGWLHHNWKNSRVSKLHKGYMVVAIGALMAITSLGIYGFLAKGHLEQQTPLAPVELQIAQKADRVSQLDADLKQQQVRLGQLDSAVNSMIGGDKAAMAMRFRAKQSNERTDIQKKIDTDNAEKMKLSQELVPLKLQVNEVETKLGPVKYVADLFGLKDTEGAVRIVILILMTAFDPLAVVLVLSATITLAEAAEERRMTKKEATVEVTNSGLTLEELEEAWGCPASEVSEKLRQFSEQQQRVDLPQEDDGTVVTLVEEEVELEPEVVLETSVEPIDEEIIQPDLEPEMVVETIEEPEQTILQELEIQVNPPEPVVEKSDKDLIVELLEMKPEILQEVIDIVTEMNRKKEEISSVPQGDKVGWLDSTFRMPR